MVALCGFAEQSCAPWSCRSPSWCSGTRRYGSWGPIAPPRIRRSRRRPPGPPSSAGRSGTRTRAWCGRTRCTRGRSRPSSSTTPATPTGTTAPTPPGCSGRWRRCTSGARAGTTSATTSSSTAAGPSTKAGRAVSHGPCAGPTPPGSTRTVWGSRPSAPSTPVFRCRRRSSRASRRWARGSWTGASTPWASCGWSRRTTRASTSAVRPSISTPSCGHRDTFQTYCPGEALYAQLPAIRKEMARLRARKS